MEQFHDTLPTVEYWHHVNNNPRHAAAPEMAVLHLHLPTHALL